MEDELTTEELEAKLEKLTKERLERELAIEEQKLKDAKEADEATKEEQLKAEMRDEVRSELLTELAKESNITDDNDGQPDTLAGGNSKEQLFLSKYRENNNLKGISYENLVENLRNKGGY